MPFASDKSWAVFFLENESQERFKPGFMEVVIQFRDKRLVGDADMHLILGEKSWDNMLSKPVSYVRVGADGSFGVTSQAVKFLAAHAVEVAFQVFEVP